MSTCEYKPSPGTHIEQAVKEAYRVALQAGVPVEMEFNERRIMVWPQRSEADNILTARRAMGLPDVDPPFHPVTAVDALEKWDKGELLFTIEMGGLGPGYEQAIQILVFEIIRDEMQKPLPGSDDRMGWEAFGNRTVARMNRTGNGGYSGAQVGAAKNVAFRALRDGWGKMVESIPKDRLIQVSKHFPTAPEIPSKPE